MRQSAPETRQQRYIDTAGKTVIIPQYGNAFLFANGFATVEVGDKDDYIDKTGNYI